MPGPIEHITTGTTSMAFNATSQRATSSMIMNYTNRKISAIGIKIDSLRLAFTDITGETQLVNKTSAGTGLMTDYLKVFQNANAISPPASGVIPTVHKFSPTVASAWDTSDTSAPVYTGDASLISIYGHVVLRLTGSGITSNVLQLGVFIDNFLLGIGTEGYIDANSPYNAIAVPQQTSDKKSTTDMSINVVIPLAKGQSVSLRIRNSTNNAIEYDYFQANLYCRPIELTGTEISGVA